LRDGELEIVGRVTDASNATFLCRVTPATPEDPDSWADDEPATDSELAIYKPTRGERPLDDFPSGTLARRELAAYILSAQTGWNIVPPTVMRDGPFGEGMVQAWIEADESVDQYELVLKADDRLRTICVFDTLVNNADRKGSHLLPAADGHIFGIDHGICFSADDKLRTVLWAWRGDPIEPELLSVARSVCESLDGALGYALRELLSADEVAATARRASELVAAGVYPQPSPFRPAVPWPPF
jgi:uncharacterized repeat protein (TIGR03843 family)